MMIRDKVKYRLDQLLIIRDFPSIVLIEFLSGELLDTTIRVNKTAGHSKMEIDHCESNHSTSSGVLQRLPSILLPLGEC